MDYAYYIDILNNKGISRKIKEILQSKMKGVNLHIIQHADTDTTRFNVNNTRIKYGLPNLTHNPMYNYLEKLKLIRTATQANTESLNQLDEVVDKYLKEIKEHNQKTAEITKEFFSEEQSKIRDKLYNTNSD